jgi:hypothetical protein
MNMTSFLSMMLSAGLFLGVAFPLGASAAAKPQDVIAKVGDQTITFSQIDIMINSSDVAGMPIPSPGTQARNETRLLVLDKVISANLLYLDALKKGIQSDPVYRQDVERFSGAILGPLYRRNLDKDITVTDEEVRNFYKNNIAKGTPFTPEVRKSIEARLREERFKAEQAEMQKRLREGVHVTRGRRRGGPSRSGNHYLGRTQVAADEFEKWRLGSRQARCPERAHRPAHRHEQGQGRPPGSGSNLSCPV